MFMSPNFCSAMLLTLLIDKMVRRPRAAHTEVGRRILFI